MSEFSWPCEFPVIEREVGFVTLISSGEGGIERRRSKVSIPKREFDVSFSVLSTTDIDAIWNFYLAKTGAFASFTWTRPARYSGDSPLEYTVRFKHDGLSREWFAANLHKTGITFIQVL